MGGRKGCNIPCWTPPRNGWKSSCSSLIKSPKNMRFIQPGSLSFRLTQRGFLEPWSTQESSCDGSREVLGVGAYMAKKILMNVLFFLGIFLLYWIYTGIT